MDFERKRLFVALMHRLLGRNLHSKRRPEIKPCQQPTDGQTHKDLYGLSSRYDFCYGIYSTADINQAEPKKTATQISRISLRTLGRLENLPRPPSDECRERKYTSYDYHDHSRTWGYGGWSNE